jgi:hypothetical protein
MLDVRIDTVKIFTTNSTYHCEMQFGTTVAYRRREKGEEETKSMLHAPVSCYIVKLLVF